MHDPSDERRTDDEPRTAIEPGEPLLAAINVGSSSVRVAIFRARGGLAKVASAKIERLGSSDAALVVKDAGGRTIRTVALSGGSWVERVVEAAGSMAAPGEIVAVGHRVVHGGARFDAPARVTPAMLRALRELSPYDPEHMPCEIAVVEGFSARHAEVVQVACFDTAFHASMPRVARLLPIPREMQEDGLRRYGFHGLAFASVMAELARRSATEAKGRVVLAHLGGGASLAAVEHGKSIDTTMGFTPASGIPMGTRSGDLDPGIVCWLARSRGMSIDAFHAMVNKRSGLLGMSGTSSDVRDLLAREASDERAAEALELFRHGVRKAVGAMAAVLGGIDALVFSGGIGENAPAIRARVCERLEHLGVELDPARNASNAPVLSRDSSRVRVHRIEADEEREIACSVSRMLGSERAGASTHAPGEHVRGGEHVRPGEHGGRP